MKNEFTRREFLVISGKLAAMMGLGASAVPDLAGALETMYSGNAKVLWLQGQSCSGCTVSLLNNSYPNPVELMTRYISMLFNTAITASTGEVSLDLINASIDRGGYYLVVEGAVPADMPEACMMGGEPVADQIIRAAKNAKAIIAVGTCAAFGGIPAAENNQTGAVGVMEFFKRKGVKANPINLPGCPAHPEWITGTLAHLLKFGKPALDGKNRPLMFYARYVHDQCPRFADYERESFADMFSGEGCLFKLGCVGPNTFGDCTIRQWNSGINSCINAGAPCIGCTSDTFALKAGFPFYRKGEILDGLK